MFSVVVKYLYEGERMPLFILSVLIVLPVILAVILFIIYTNKCKLVLFHQHNCSDFCLVSTVNRSTDLYPALTPSLFHLLPICLSMQLSHYSHMSSCHSLSLSASVSLLLYVALSASVFVYLSFFLINSYQYF